MSRINKSGETESRLVVVRPWKGLSEKGGNGERLTDMVIFRFGFFFFFFFDVMKMLGEFPGGTVS